MNTDITFCTNHNCEKRNDCKRNVENKYYPKVAGEIVSCVLGCRDYELFLEVEE